MHDSRCGHTVLQDLLEGLEGQCPLLHHLQAQGAYVAYLGTLHPGHAHQHDVLIAVCLAVLGLGHPHAPCGTILGPTPGTDLIQNTSTSRCPDVMECTIMMECSIYWSLPECLHVAYAHTPVLPRPVGCRYAHIHRPQGDTVLTALLLLAVQTVVRHLGHSDPGCLHILPLWHRAL